MQARLSGDLVDLSKFVRDIAIVTTMAGSSPLIVGHKRCADARKKYYRRHANHV